MGTGPEGTGLTFQVDQPGGQVRRCREEDEVKTISVKVMIEEDDEEVLGDLRKELDNAISNIVGVGGHERFRFEIGPWENEYAVDLSRDLPVSQ